MKPFRLCRKKVAIWAIAGLLLLSLGIVYGHYYSEDFSTGATGWQLGYRYGRAGITRNPSDMTVQAAGDGYLRFRNNVNNNTVAYIGSWAGRMAFYNGVSYNSSVTNPFGVEFRRTYSRIDPHARIYTSNNPESHRHMAAMSFWLVNDPNNLADTDTEFTSFPNYVLVYDMMRMNYNTSTGQPRSTWGYYIASEQRFDLSQAQRPTGEYVNITNNTTYTLEWNYDDYYGVDSYDATGDGTGGTGGTANANANNNNPVIVRITHDGSTARFYINPNPDDTGGNPYPNEFLLVGSSAISWSSDIKIMLGMESKRHDCEMQAADIDSVLVRSVASSIKSEIYPAKIAKGSTNTYQIVVSPTFTANDAGIGELIIRKPANFTDNWSIGDVQVFTDNGTGTNHGAISTLNLMTYTGSVPTVNNQVYISVTNSGRDLKLRFRQAANSLTDTGVINNNTSDKRIVVLFKMVAPNTANAVGDQFEVYADCVKYNGQSYPRWATTGKMKSQEGDAYGSVFTADNLKVKSFIDPQALATVSPDLVYVGNNKVIYLYVATTNANSPDISELRIKVPDGYTVNTADPTKFTSLYIANDNYVFATNVSGTNYIYVQYAADGGSLPGQSGLDRITIQVDSTPTNFSGAQTNTYWYAYVSSSVPGTVQTECKTNGDYPNRLVRVRQLPPSVQATVATALVENSTNYLYNHEKNNQITYTINNTGSVGNNIKKIRIRLPQHVTNVADIHSATIPDPAELANIVWDFGSREIRVDYQGAGTVIAGSGSDTITFRIIDSITPMSGSTNISITADADNDNGDGYVAATEGSGSWSITWRNPPASGNASLQTLNSITTGYTNNIYTSDVSTSLKISVNNNGGTYNDIKLVEITLPTQFTNIHSQTSLYMQNSGTNISIVGNKLYIKYYENRVAALSNTMNDTITVTGVDNVALTAAGSASITVRVANTTNVSDLQATGNLGLANKNMEFILPPVMASGSSIVEGSSPVNLIDSSTITNVIAFTITNEGVYDNYISEVRIYVPDTIASNIVALNHTHAGSLSSHTTDATNFIRVFYNGTKLYGGETDTIRFEVIDHVSGYTNLNIVAVASNVRAQFSTLPTTAGATNNIIMRLPPASAAAHVLPGVVFITNTVTETNVLVLTISNTGKVGNDITNAVVTFPAVFSFPNNIIYLSNTVAGSYIDYPGGASPITIRYTNIALAGRSSDKLYFVFRNNFKQTDLQNDLAFSCSVDNGEGSQSATVPSGKALSFSILDRPQVYIEQSDATPNEIYTTDVLSTFTYYVRNGQSGGKGIKRLMIALPYPFVDDPGVNVINSFWPGSAESVISNNGAKIVVDYSLNDLDPGELDPIQLTVKDVLVQGITNVSWEAWVDYGDGSGYHSTRVTSGKSIDIAFVFPDASAKANVYTGDATKPRQLNMTTYTNQLSVIITNDGITGNHIKMVEIDLGSAITNITNPTSTIAGVTVTNTANKLFVNYAAYNTNLPSSKSDTISFIVYDNVSAISNVQVSVRIANSTNVASYKSASEITTDSLTLEFYRPDFTAAAYIVPVTPVSPAKPSTIYSTVTTSTLAFTIVNNGAPGNNLDELKIYIPSVVFDPATFVYMSSTKGLPSASVTRVGNLVTLYYTNSSYQLLANQSDKITFRINDLVTSSNSSAQWVSTAHFTTSGVSYETNAISSGQSDNILLEMPLPVVSARILQKPFYVTSSNFMLVMDLSNSGTGSNNVTNINITIPSDLRAGLSSGTIASRITNSFSATVAYSAGVISLGYTNFSVGKNDKVFIALSNSVSTATTLTVSGTTRNSVQQAAISTWVGDPNSLLLSAESQPSFYVEAVSEKDGVANRFYSTDHKNQVKIYIRNDGTGSYAIKKAKIIFPANFQLSTVSSRFTPVMNALNNEVSIDYDGGGSSIPVGDYDMITLDVTDPYGSGTQTADISVYVGDIDLVGVHDGYSTTRLFSGKLSQLYYVHPAADVEYYINNYGSGVKPAIVVAPRSTIAMTNVQIKIDNLGVHSNALHKVRLSIPDIFIGISNFSSTVPGAVYGLTNSQLYVNYNGQKLAAGASDTVSFDLYYSLSDATNNLLFTVESDNNNGSGLASSAVKNSWFNALDVKYPPIVVFSGVKNVTDIYTINTNETIIYSVKNRSQGYAVRQVVITNFYMTNFDKVTVNSLKASSVTVNTNAGQITLTYTAGVGDPFEFGIPFNETDTVSLGIYYRITNSIRKDLTLQAFVLLTNSGAGSVTNVNCSVLDVIDTDTGTSDNQKVTIGPAPFAKILGIILPRFKVDNGVTNSFLPNIVKVEVVALNSTTPITTPYAKEMGPTGSLVDKTLFIYSDSSDGSYSMNYVPAGSYRLRFSATGFKVMYTNVTFTSNTVYTLPTYTMQNDYLSSDAQAKQMVVDYNDTNTRFMLSQNGILDQFSLDINVVDMNTSQEGNVNSSSSVQGVSDTTVLGCFQFTITDRFNQLVTGIGLGDYGDLILHYTTANLNLPIGSDWNESDLAIYYWKTTTKEWIPVGGVVDTVKKTVTARVNYLHNTYAVLSLKAGVNAKTVYNVKASPNPFAPDRGTDATSKVKLTFSFNQSYKTYEVNIYDMRGRRVRHFTGDGSYRQGEVFWNGRNDAGHRLPGGVYLYQIKAGGKVYTGTILMLK